MIKIKKIFKDKYKELFIKEERERSLHERANMINSVEERGDLNRAKVGIKNMLEKGMDKKLICELLEK